MSLCIKECKECGKANHVRATACGSCGTTYRKRGRPKKVTEEDGFQVSHGRPRGTRQCPEFDNAVQLPADWDHSIKLVNVDDELLDVCARRITQQRTFDRKPLGLAVC